MRKIYCVICGKCKNFIKNLNYYTFLKKHQFFLLLSISVRMKMKKMLKKEESMEVLKFFCLIENMQLLHKND